MKKQITFTVTALMMASAALAGGPKVNINTKEKERLEHERAGGKVETVASKSNAATNERLTRIEAAAKRYSVDKNKMAAALEKELTFEEPLPAKEGEKAQFVTKTVRAEELFRKLEEAEKKGVSVESIQIGMTLLESLATLSSGARPGMSAKMVETANKETMKFANDYIETMINPKSEAADIESYVVLGRGFEAYKKNNPNATPDQVYTQGVPEDARQRQRDCL